MIKKLKIIILLLLSINCKAQTSIINIIDDDGSEINGAYYKDIDSLLDPFEGTYIYTNGTTIFKMVLVKKVQQYNSQYYEDLIIGEYQYIKDGVQIANTLSEISTTYLNQRNHKIEGNLIVDKNYRTWKCPSCSLAENRLSTQIEDVVSEKIADLIMHRTTENGQEVMKIKITNPSGGSYLEVEGPPAEFSLPLGELTLIKQ